MEHDEKIEEQALDLPEVQPEVLNWLAEVDLSSITRRVADGSYVVQKNGLPYHVPDSEEFAEFFSQLDEYARAHPEAVTEERPHVPTEEEERRAEIEARIAELQEYLRSTDWYAIRFADSGVEIPAGVKQARQEARDEIDTLRAELEALAAAKA
ncbi:hypothetical protein [Mailhella sp.]